MQAYSYQHKLLLSSLGTFSLGLQVEGWVLKELQHRAVGGCGVLIQERVLLQDPVNG